MTWKCLFSHDWVYMSDYGRKCRRCPANRPGWGNKRLEPGDDFSKIQIALNPVELNPDELRAPKKAVDPRWDCVNCYKLNPPTNRYGCIHCGSNAC